MPAVVLFDRGNSLRLAEVRPERRRDDEEEPGPASRYLVTEGTLAGGAGGTGSHEGVILSSTGTVSTESGCWESSVAQWKDRQRSGAHVECR